MPESGCRWSTCGRRHQAVHRGVDRRRGAAPAVQAVVERGDHLVLAVDARVDVDERAQPVEAEDGEAGLGQGAQVAAGALDPQQLDRLPGDRVGLGALGGGVAAGVVGVARVCAEPVAAAQQVADHGVRHEKSCSWVSRGGFRRPSRPAGRRRARGRCAPGSPSARVGGVRVGVEALALAELGQQRPDVGVVGVHQHAVGAEHVTGALGRGQRLPVDEQRLRRRLLDVHHRPDLAGDLRLDVVALVEHEVDARRRAEGVVGRRSRS